MQNEMLMIEGPVMLHHTGGDQGTLVRNPAHDPYMSMVPHTAAARQDTPRDTIKNLEPLDWDTPKRHSEDKVLI